MMALPPVRPSDCSVVLCKAALPVTFKEEKDRWARTPTGPALTKAPCWLGEGTTGPAATPGPGASTMGPPASASSLAQVCLLAPPCPRPGSATSGRLTSPPKLG